MFTGIITDLGRVGRLHRGDLAELTIATAFDTSAIPLGASIACSGVCLTVVGVAPGEFSVQASAETLACTTIGEWEEGTSVTLEKSLRGGDELGGHLVAGHVDGIARIGERRPGAAPGRLGLEAPGRLASLIGRHASVGAAPYYTHIADKLRKGVERALTAVGATHEIISVPGAFEIPAAIGLVAQASDRFDGFVALGCVIRGETTHYDHICAESARGLQDLAVRDGLAIGYGILTVENEAQALARASAEHRDKGGEAVRACLALVDLERRLAGEENDDTDRAAARRSSAGRA